MLEQPKKEELRTDQGIGGIPAQGEFGRCLGVSREVYQYPESVQECLKAQGS